MLGAPAASAAQVAVTPLGPGGVPMPALSGFGPVATFDQVTPTAYGQTTPAPTFSDGGGVWTGTGLVMNNPPGTAAGLYADPANDPSNYMAVLGGRAETVTYTRLQDKLGLYWGSIDNYNVITLYDGAASVVVPIPPDADGDQYSSASNRYFVITGFDFDKVVFSSGANSFEFDNVAAAPAPEPSTWMLLLAGFAGLGAVRARALRRGGVKSRGVGAFARRKLRPSC